MNLMKVNRVVAILMILNNKYPKYQQIIINNQRMLNKKALS